VLFPFGDATGEGNDSFGGRYAWQLPLAIDLGARFLESFYAGAYFGFGFGSTGSDSRLEAACTDDDDDGTNDIVCNVISLRAGISANYSFAPGGRTNPWIGYGFGFESTSATYTDHERNYQEDVTGHGLTLAQLAFGLDIRRAVGVGPFVEVAIGQFNKTTTTIGDQKYSVAVRDRALHAWIMLGLRIVVNP
jgi:hypothetical protein